MAKTEETKIELEREYNVPLRKGWLKSPKYKRAKKAIRTLKEFLQRHMKSENVKIGKYANIKVWEKGMQNPPHHLKVKVTKDSEGKVMAELVGAPVDMPKESKKGKKGTKAEAPKAPEEKKEVKGEEAKAPEAKKAETDKGEEKKTPSPKTEKEATTMPEEKKEKSKPEVKKE
jgi:large subunit ribosomal protein L31e